MRLYAYDIISVYNLYTHICKLYMYIFTYIYIIYVYITSTNLPGEGMWEKSHCTVARLLLTVSHTISKSMDIFLQLAMVVCCLMHQTKQPLPTSPSQVEGTWKNLFPMWRIRGAFNHPTQKWNIYQYQHIYHDYYSATSWNDSWTLEACEHVLATLATQVTSLNIWNGQNSTVNLCLVGDWSKQNLQDQSHLLHGCCLKIPETAHGYQQICQLFS